MQFTFPGSEYRPLPLVPRYVPSSSFFDSTVASSSSSSPSSSFAAQQTNAARVPWGEPVWTLFHVMAEQVRESRFAEAREGLFQVVKLMGANLPCADCAMHAQTYLAAVDWSLLQSKAAFRLFLCGFHNAVNARKGVVPLFRPDDLAARYGALDITAVAARALFFFQGKHARSNGGLVPNTLSRDRAANLVRAWFAANTGILFQPSTLSTSSSLASLS